MSIDDAVSDGMKSFLERITLWRIIRTTASAAAICVPIWAFTGSYVMGLADDTVTNILKKKGIDPQSIQGMQLQLQDIAKSVDALKTEAEAEKRRKQDDVRGIKEQNEKILKILEGR